MVLALIGSVHGAVERRLVRVDFKDRPPRVVGAFSVYWVVYEFVSHFHVDDLLDVLVGNPMELQEELPSVHIALD